MSRFFITLTTSRLCSKCGEAIKAGDVEVKVIKRKAKSPPNEEDVADYYCLYCARSQARGPDGRRPR